MGQGTSKNRSKTSHRASNKKSKGNGTKNDINAIETNSCCNSESDENDDVFSNGQLQYAPSQQEELATPKVYTVSQDKEMKVSVPTDESDQTSQNKDGLNHHRIRRFRDKLAEKLKRVDMQYVLETFLNKDIFNRKEYNEIKIQLQPKWMCWRLVYTLEMKMKNDDLIGKTTVFDLFIECLESPRVRRKKLACRLRRENGDPCPSWCSDGKDDGILDLADGLVLTPYLLDSVLEHVHCSEQLSWWRWIPYELGLRNLSSVSSDPESPEHESQHSRLKNALYQWGTTEGFARGGLEILILAFRNHMDACEVNWRGMRKIFRNRRGST